MSRERGSGKVRLFAWRSDAIAHHCISSPLACHRLENSHEDTTQFVFGAAAVYIDSSVGKCPDTCAASPAASAAHWHRSNATAASAATGHSSSAPARANRGQQSDAPATHWHRSAAASDTTDHQSDAHAADSHATASDTTDQQSNAPATHWHHSDATACDTADQQSDATTSAADASAWIAHRQ